MRLHRADERTQTYSCRTVGLHHLRSGVGCLALVALLLGSTAPATHAQQPTDDQPTADTTPLESDLEEEVGVHLVLVDTVVIDRDGRTVADLAIDDFEIIANGNPVPIDTLDASCRGGSLDDPQQVRRASKRTPLPAPDSGRRLVIALDYFHLDQIARVDVLARAREMVRHGLTANDEVMIAAFAGGLRVEQTFTSDVEQLVDTLERMEYDISLWNGNFTHLNERPFFDGMQTLFDVLGTVPGSKGIVLYSNSPAASDENDPDFARVAASASASRCSIYPVHATGLSDRPPG